MADRWEQVRAVIDTIGYARNSMVLPLTGLLESGAWREFVTPNGETVTHETFSAFAEEQPNRGLGVPAKILAGFLDGSNYVAAAAKLRDALPGVPRAVIPIDDPLAAVWVLLQYYDAAAIIAAVKQVAPRGSSGQLPMPIPGE